MSIASTKIFTEKSSNVGRKYFRIAVHSADGSPLPGVELRVILEGDGSLQPNFDSKSVVRTTDDGSHAEVTWYRRNIFTRDIKATLTVTSPDVNSVVVIEETEAPVELKTGWTPRRGRI